MASGGVWVVPSEVVSHEVRVLREVDRLQRQSSEPLPAVDGLVLRGKSGARGEVQGRLDRAGEGRGGTESSAADSTGREIGAPDDAGLTCADATPAPPILLPCSRASINDMTTLSVRSTLRRSHSPRRERVASDLAGRRAIFFVSTARGSSFKSRVFFLSAFPSWQGKNQGLEMPRSDWPVVPRLALSATTPGIGQLDPRPRAPAPVSNS